MKFVDLWHKTYLVGFDHFWYLCSLSFSIQIGKVMDDFKRVVENGERFVKNMIHVYDILKRHLHKI